jgi:Glycosyl hydrolases family 28
MVHRPRLLIDRRQFVQKAALLVGGSALGCSLAGCNSEGLVIPCLGPAPPPAPAPGMTYIRASEIGCALDCDLRNGRNLRSGGPATDDGPRINAALAGATADHPITFIIDGSALISGLFLPAGGYWAIAGLGCGTGFFVESGANNDGIHNGPPDAAIPFDPGPPAPARGRNISLSNFTVNGNQGNGFSGNSTSGTRQGVTGRVWYCGINLMNLDNISIENVVVVNTPAYHVRLSNVGNVKVSGCIFWSSGGNTDGLHFDGPANDIAISGCGFRTGDDSIALNCPEGHTGDISRVTVDNCRFDSLSLMRLYTTTGGAKPVTSSIDSVSVSNCTGSLRVPAFFMGLASGSRPNSIDNLTISDCSLAAPAILGVAENFGSIVLRNVTFNSPAGFMAPAAPYIPFVGASLSFQNCRISGGGGIATILGNGSVIDKVEFNGFAAQTSLLLVEVLWGTIGQLILDSVDSSNVLGPTNNFASIGSVSGAGVLATGWQFPDAVMADGVPYISASTGLPSIKNNGVVQLYALP